MRQNKYEKWNILKEILDDFPFNLPCTEGEIWWVAWGLNVGTEMYGKGEDFTRIGIIIRKPNDNSLFVIPLSSTEPKKFPFMVNHPHLKESHAVINQMRIISNKRLLKYVGILDAAQLQIIKSVAEMFINKTKPRKF